MGIMSKETADGQIRRPAWSPEFKEERKSIIKMVLIAFGIIVVSRQPITMRMSTLLTVCVQPDQLFLVGFQSWYFGAYVGSHARLARRRD